MTEQHPITLPQELFLKWTTHREEHNTAEQFWRHIANEAAQWGADQELDACCEYIAGRGKWFCDPQYRLDELRAARRPKPPSQAEEAMLELEEIMDELHRETGSAFTATGIRRALERLQELEGQVNG